MKSKIVKTLALGMLVFGLVGCQVKEQTNTVPAIQEQTVAEPTSTVVIPLPTQEQTVVIPASETKISDDLYVLTISVKQSHFTLDLSEHFKDSMNEGSFQIPVTKEYYDQINIGDSLDDSFRMGSFIFKGSVGSWKITVKNKEIVKAN